MDAVGRALVDPWASTLKQRIVIDNRGGAGGTVGTTIVAQAPPDGHTILYANLGPLSIGPSLYRKLGYDLFKDLAPVSLVGSSPIVIFVSTSLPVQSVKDFVAYAKAQAGTAQLRDERHRQRAASHRRALQERGGNRHGARSLQGRRPGRGRHRERPHSGPGQHLFGHHPAPEGGAPAAGDHRRLSAQHAHARRAHRRGSRLSRFSEHCMARGGRACRNTQGRDLAASSHARRRARHCPSCARGSRFWTSSRSAARRKSSAAFSAPSMRSGTR